MTWARHHPDRPPLPHVRRLPACFRHRYNQTEYTTPAGYPNTDEYVVLLPKTLSETCTGFRLSSLTAKESEVAAAWRFHMLMFWNSSYNSTADAGAFESMKMYLYRGGLTAEEVVKTPITLYPPISFDPAEVGRVVHVARGVSLRYGRQVGRRIVSKCTSLVYQRFGLEQAYFVLAKDLDPAPTSRDTPCIVGLFRQQRRAHTQTCRHRPISPQVPFVRGFLEYEQQVLLSEQVIHTYKVVDTTTTPWHNAEDATTLAADYGTDTLASIQLDVRTQSFYQYSEVDPLDVVGTLGEISGFWLVVPLLFGLLFYRPESRGDDQSEMRSFSVCKRRRTAAAAPHAAP